jgi:hypothetical protein
VLNAPRLTQRVQRVLGVDAVAPAVAEPLEGELPPVVREQMVTRDGKNAKQPFRKFTAEAESLLS